MLGSGVTGKASAEHGSALQETRSLSALFAVQPAGQSLCIELDVHRQYAQHFRRVQRTALQPQARYIQRAQRVHQQTMPLRLAIAALCDRYQIEAPEIADSYILRSAKILGLLYFSAMQSQNDPPK